jgi:hypothetical protein
MSLILDFLSKMPQLQTFNLQISGSPDDEQHAGLNKLCESLTIIGGRCKYLPTLEECSFLRAHNIDLLDVTLIAQFIQSRTQDLPSYFISLERIKIWGNFGFMTDLREEVACLSSAEPSVEINIRSVPSFYTDPSYRNPLGLELIPFSNANNPQAHYTHVVNHI